MVNHSWPLLVKTEYNQRYRRRSGIGRGLLVNARHIPFGVTVRELVGRRALSFIGCHIMNDESVVFGLSQPTPAQRKAAYWLCGAGVALIWPLGTLTAD